MQEWNKCDVFYNRKNSCTGGWIEIIDLPLKWWKEEIFVKIGAKCGGLLQIDERTKKMSSLFAPRICVKGNNSGFIPSEIDLVKNEETITVRLRVISSL